jgi:hypothetical protein
MRQKILLNYSVSPVRVDSTHGVVVQLFVALQNNRRLSTPRDRKTFAHLRCWVRTRVVSGSSFGAAYVTPGPGFSNFLFCELTVLTVIGGTTLLRPSRKTHVAHRRMKTERVYRPYLTALEAEYSPAASRKPLQS